MVVRDGKIFIGIGEPSVIVTCCVKSASFSVLEGINTPLLIRRLEFSLNTQSWQCCQLCITS